MAGVGRPTKYTPEFLESARYYLDNYTAVGDAMPSISGLAVYTDVRRVTLYDWAKHDDKQEFADIMGRILDKQENVLMNNGLTGDFNAAITKLALGKHGYHDKQDNTHSGPDGGAIETDNTWTVKVVD